jgi:hypothetical protein
MIFPGRALAGIAEEVTIPTERRTALRKVLKAGGFAGFLIGVNPCTTSDEKLAEKTKGIPLLIFEKSMSHSNFEIAFF